MALQPALRPYRFVTGSRQHEMYDWCDRHPAEIARQIDLLRDAYRGARGKERAKVARLGEAFQQLHEKHFGARH